MESVEKEEGRHYFEVRELGLKRNLKIGKVEVLLFTCLCCEFYNFIFQYIVALFDSYHKLLNLRIT